MTRHHQSVGTGNLEKYKIHTPIFFDDYRELQSTGEFEVGLCVQQVIKMKEFLSLVINLCST